MKIYLITSGEYSDYSVESAWDSKEAAEKYIEEISKRFGENPYKRIEEYELNVVEDLKDLNWYEAYIYEREPDNVNITMTDRPQKKLNLNEEYIRNLIERKKKGIKILWSIWANGKTEEHARRSALQQRDKLLQLLGEIQ